MAGAPPAGWKLPSAMGALPAAPVGTAAAAAGARGEPPAPLKVEKGAQGGAEEWGRPVT